MLTLSEKAEISVCDIKKQYGILAKDGRERYFDILIAAYLLNPLKNDYDTESIAGEHLGLMIPGRTEVFGKKTEEAVYAENPAKATEYACYGAYAAFVAKEVLAQKRLRKS